MFADEVTVICADSTRMCKSVQFVISSTPPSKMLYRQSVHSICSRKNCLIIRLITSVSLLVEVPCLYPRAAALRVKSLLFHSQSAINPIARFHHSFNRSILHQHTFVRQPDLPTTSLGHRVICSGLGSVCSTHQYRRINLTLILKTFLIKKLKHFSHRLRASNLSFSTNWIRKKGIKVLSSK